ncbi:thiamine phosphate synthase [Flavobacterium sp. L1I52]|uniref:Thiamine phosphate synthase n=1 Tax=Flavobacterium pokkalii TaxID=1940408 RepID=A0ABR7UP27_9FLAO|nr:thiamine phosphate synthase [Flavobacterium pokkalii]MBD0724347.1 thiamine phosphate synthase [Flavobacterium pokkalii]
MIIISNPIAVANEIKTVHALFENGLELFHIRKPEFSEEEMKAFVAAIGLEFRNRLVLHSYHHLAKEFGINRIHFSSTNRPDNFSKPNGFTVSTSTHSIEEFNALSEDFGYAFLSPVFKSISKENYEPKTNWATEIKKRINFQTKLIGLGGIQDTNLHQALQLGFDEVALLGSIWNSENPIQNFKLCQQIVLSY